jgi:hypothetical protein
MPARQWKSVIGTAGSDQIPARLVAETSALLARLTAVLLGSDRPDPGEGPQRSSGIPVHLSYTGIPGQLDRALALSRSAAAGDRTAQRALAEWVGTLDQLTGAVARLHRSGAIPAETLEAYRVAVAAHASGIRAWAAWRRQTSPPRPRGGAEAGQDGSRRGRAPG